MQTNRIRELSRFIVDVFRLLAIYLKPVLPHYSDKVSDLFNESTYVWPDVNKNIIFTTIDRVIAKTIIFL